MIKPKIIAHYKMNDNLGTVVVLDGTGNHHGTYKDGSGNINTDTGDQTGKVNNALDFGFADSEYIEITDHADFSPGNGTAVTPGSGTPFSISAWVYMDDAVDFQIASKGVYNSNAEWSFDTKGSKKLKFKFYDESEDNCYIGMKYDTALDTGKWLHTVGTYDGGTKSSGIKLYLNGARVDDGIASLEPGDFDAIENDLGHAVWIGRHIDDYANGLIDDVMFFSAELTLDEVRILFNAGSGTENLVELDQEISPRRSNLSIHALRRRYEFA